MTDANDIHALKDALARVAAIVVEDPIYAPIFARLELEVKELEANDPVARASAIAALARTRRDSARAG